MDTKSKIFIPIIAVLFVGLLCYLYLGFIRKSTIPTASQEEASAKAWQIYKNDKLGLEFNHPSGMIIEETNNYGNMGFWGLYAYKSANDQKNAKNWIATSPSPSTYFTISNFGNTTGLDFKTWYQKQYENVGMSPAMSFQNNVKKMNLNPKLDIYYYVGEGPGQGNGNFVLSKDGNFFIVDTGSNLDSPDSDKTIIQILSTFKFNTPVPTANTPTVILTSIPDNWVTIKYTKYNLIFSFPQGWYFNNNALDGKYRQINKNETIDSYFNYISLKKTADSKNSIEISLNKVGSTNLKTYKYGEEVEFDQIISIIKFTQ